jgi:pyridoxine 4-dehydrogenase
VAEVCRELGIALIAYSPLALGLLSRSEDPRSPTPAGPRGALFSQLGPKLTPLRQAMGEMAQGRPGGLVAVALNWCRAHGAMPIPGLRSPEQMDQTADALSWVLSAAERQRLDALVLATGAARMPANPFQSA